MVMNDPFKRNNTNTQGQNIWYFCGDMIEIVPI